MADTGSTGGGAEPELRLVTRLFADEAARLMEWVADGLEKGEVVVEQGAHERRFRPDGPVRTTVRAERQQHGGRVRIELEWEDDTGELVVIQPD